MDDVAEVEIHGIAAGGDGVGRVEGMVVFVPRAAIGDVVRVRLDRRKRFARGEIESVVRASPDRVEPPCRHYTVDRCGGCQLQHIAYDAQRLAKATIIRDSLQRIAKRASTLPDVTASERQWRYRGKLTLALRRESFGWVAGLHPYDDPLAVFALDDCPITDEAVVGVWREIIAASELLPDADALRASVRLMRGGSAVVVEGGSEWPTRDDFFAAVPSITGLWWKPESHARQLVAERAAATAGASFAQVNAAVAAQLRDHVLAIAMTHAPRTVVDGYAGTGDTAAALADKGVRVTAIELDVDAAARCAARLPSGSRSLNGRVEDLLAQSLPADVVILNPPRGGIHERVAAALQRVRRAPAALIYVSCDPATLARDVARMPRYRIASLLAFDMFPQTAHVETVCALVPEAA